MAIAAHPRFRWKTSSGREKNFSLVLTGTMSGVIWPCCTSSSRMGLIILLFKFRFQRRADMHRAALLFVGFYGILLAERRCPASAAVMLPPSRHIVPRQEEVQFFVILLTVRMFLHENLREDSTMEILNTVIALLGLLATVILGTAKITWTIAQVFFRDMHHAKHYIKK